MILLQLLVACSGSPTPPEPAAPVLPPIEHTRPTTRSPMAVAGLNARAQNLAAAVDRLPEARAAVLDTLALRVALLGQVSDLDQMFEVAGETPSRARALMAVHRFDEALGLDPSLADSVALARHQRLDELETARRAAVETRPSTENWQKLADVLAAQGRAADADAAYWEALQAYRDVSPLQVADLQFRRGLAWGETGEDPARARALYLDAVTRLPEFVRAEVHLAELEWQAGDHTAAIARVREVADAEDPEPGGKLAVWLEGAEADVWRTRTIAAYDALLARHRLAFADHAAEFYLALGDAETARPLAQANLDNRHTPRAVELCERAGCETP